MYYIKSKQDSGYLELAKDIITFLKKNNLPFVIDPSLPLNETKKRLNEVEAKIILSIGGDDTLLITFLELKDSEIPVLGISLGQSFLAQSNASTFKESINLIEKKRFTIVKKSRIYAEFGKNKTIAALNDIAVFPSKIASLLRFSLNINNKQVWKDNADGIVIATPTGSTGHSLSGGGPILLNEPNVYAITSIASINKNPTVIVPDNLEIELKGIEGFSPVLILDGKHQIKLTEEDVKIKTSKSYANFIKLPTEDSLQKKLKRRSFKINSNQIKELPPSAKVIYKILSYEEALTQKEIINETYLPSRTVRHALNILLKKKLISKSINLSDIRQAIYKINIESFD